LIGIVYGLLSKEALQARFPAPSPALGFHERGGGAHRRRPPHRPSLARAEDETFDQDCRERLTWRRQTIVLAAMDRVKNPKTRPVLYRGRQIGHIGRANDRIVAALMWSSEMLGRGE
jgi:hypothetical protein